MSTARIKRQTTASATKITGQSSTMTKYPSIVLSFVKERTPEKRGLCIAYVVFCVKWQYRCKREVKTSSFTEEGG